MEVCLPPRPSRTRAYSSAVQMRAWSGVLGPLLDARPRYPNRGGHTAAIGFAQARDGKAALLRLEAEHSDPLL